jgi:two-component system, OmpR family, aerobic respiration control sensor histidine kinase ArcB
MKGVLAYACQYLERYRKAGHTQCLEDLYHQLRRVADDTLETLNRWVLMMG